MTDTQIAKLQEKVERLESQIETEMAKLREMRFDAELCRIRLSEATVKWGSASEKELLTHPKFAGILARLVKASID